MPWTRLDRGTISSAGVKSPANNIRLSDPNLWLPETYEPYPYSSFIEVSQ